MAPKQGVRKRPAAGSHETVGDLQPGVLLDDCTALDRRAKQAAMEAAARYPTPKLGLTPFPYSDLTCDAVLRMKTLTDERAVLGDRAHLGATLQTNTVANETALFGAGPFS